MSDAARSDDSYLDMIKRESNDTCNNLFMNRGAQHLQREAINTESALLICQPNSKSRFPFCCERTRR